MQFQVCLVFYFRYFLIYIYIKYMRWPGLCDTCDESHCILCFFSLVYKIVYIFNK
jgi:hypothetical protein